MVTAALPYASVNWSAGDSTVGYRMATLMPGALSAGTAADESALPAFSARDGRLLMERGMHQEIAWERHTEASGMAVMVYADDIANPVLEGSPSGAGRPLEASAANAALLDGPSGLFMPPDRNFSTAGMTASFEHRLAGGNNVRISYASGKALVMPALPIQPRSWTRRRVPAPSTRRRTRFRFPERSTAPGRNGTPAIAGNPDRPVTAVAPYAMDATGPYLNVFVRQPIRLGGGGTTEPRSVDRREQSVSRGLPACSAERGSVVIFAQGQRCIRGGLAFTF